MDFGQSALHSFTTHNYDGTGKLIRFSFVDMSTKPWTELTVTEEEGIVMGIVERPCREDRI